MTHASVKVRAVGGSAGVILPKEILDELHAAWEIRFTWFGPNAGTSSRRMILRSRKPWRGSR